MTFPKIKLDRSEELFNILSKQNPHWETFPRYWLFRGQSNSDWELLPSALRSTTSWPYLLREERVGVSKPIENQIAKEIDVVLDFAKKANYQGLPLPGNTAHMLNLLEKAGTEVRSRFASQSKLSDWDIFPFESTLELFALAQHYGIPTRIMDWTWDPLVAAYFAAHGAATEAARRFHHDDSSSVSSKRFTIWCLSSSFIRHWCNHGAPERVIIVDPPRSPNPNLLAQNGIFTLHVQSFIEGSAPQISQLDRCIYKNYLDALELRRTTYTAALLPFHDPPLLQLTLPKKEARRLLYFLSKEDVSPARLFPGYGGIVESMKEEWSLFHIDKYDIENRSGPDLVDAANKSIQPTSKSGAADLRRLAHRSNESLQ